MVEEEMERVTNLMEDEEPENDEWLQQMVHFSENPVNLNTAGRGLLMELQLLSPVQIDALLQYRRLCGPLLSLYELQAIPGWQVQTIRKLLPFVTVEQTVRAVVDLRKRLSGGDHFLLLRQSRVLEKAEGYLRDGQDGKSFYPGSRDKVLLRHKYRFGNGLHYGFTAEKDAGEAFFRGGQKAGFDFYSGHFFVRNLGKVQALALGDFTVNMGQGLIQWQGLTFNGASEIMNVKKQSEVFRPYSSAGEFNFHRGVAISLVAGDWIFSGFASRRNLDASADTNDASQPVIRSLRMAGLHRTANEQAGRGRQHMFATGARLGWQRGTFTAAFNTIRYRFSIQQQAEGRLYNLFDMKGTKWENYSMDFGYTYKNTHVFGELAMDARREIAWIGGAVISTSHRSDVSVLYRHFSKEYQSFFSSAFARGTAVNNENGLYMGANLFPSHAVQFTASADFFSFPWVRYRIDAPAEGSRYMLQLIYRPARGTEVYTRFQHQTNPLNESREGLATNAVVAKQRQTWRTQFSRALNKEVSVRCRTEVSWYDKNGRESSQGFLLFADVRYQPMLKPYGGNARLVWFSTDDYNSRIYAFENDVRFSYSVPVFYDRGFRYYFNLKYSPRKGVDVHARFAQTIYRGREEIGSGLDRIAGNTKTEVKVQLLVSF